MMRGTKRLGEVMKYKSIIGDKNTIFLLGIGVIGLFITPLVKIASMAAIGWACWQIYQDWNAQ